MEVKEVKISSKVIKKYFVSQNYKYENPKVLIIILAKYKKKQIEFVKKLRLRISLSCFTDETTFYKCPIRSRRWIILNQSYDISAMKSNIKKMLGPQSINKDNKSLFKKVKNSDV